jgi:hypothetical protein
MWVKNHKGAVKEFGKPNTAFIIDAQTKPKMCAGRGQRELYHLSVF